MAGDVFSGARLIANGYQQVAAQDAITAAGPTIPLGTMVMRVQTIGENIRWRDDGTNPTTTTGERLASGSVMEYIVRKLPLKVIAEQNTTQINYTFYK